MLIGSAGARKGAKTFRTRPSGRRKLGALRVSALLPCAPRQPRCRRGQGARKGRARIQEEVITMGNRAVITTPKRKLGLYVH